jgi:hypothetical protein
MLSRLRSTLRTAQAYSALGEDRIAARAPGHEQLVIGLEEAQRTTTR